MVTPHCTKRWQSSRRFGAGCYLNLDQGVLEQDTAIQAKRPDSNYLMRWGPSRRSDRAPITYVYPRNNFRAGRHFAFVPAGDNRGGLFQKLISPMVMMSPTHSGGLGPIRNDDLDDRDGPSRALG
jgi:hypothetical protein